ncbi:hypothetical protein [Acaryochloris sp. IP29b_bin.148]|uniref:hypothetical protein n=1 Tax=Acaryochloris sp. IP29b_bin.148 TaxID=2969218 RepID=UPI002626F667|nr:hypothetical protein [Acaryochloris sp. IP29b_bin.148]
MKTIGFRTGHVIGIGTGIAMVVGSPSVFPTPTLAIEEPPKPHQRSQTKTWPRAISLNSALAPSGSLGSNLFTTHVPFKAQQASHPRSAIAQSSPPARRTPPSSTRHPWHWIPSVFFLGFAIGIIRRVKMSLTGRSNLRHGSYHQGIDSPSGTNHYSDAGDLSGGNSRGDGGDL